MSATKRPTALVTGASRGIGAATARHLAARGYRVAVNYHTNRLAAVDVVAAIEGDGGQAVPVRADVQDPEQAAELLRCSAPDGRLDVLVCNAAARFTPAPIRSLSWDGFMKKVTDELASVYTLTQQAMEIMGPAGSGRIVFVSSAAARGPSGPGMAAHGTSKAALNAFARFAAYEAGPLGITVNVVAPGLVRTEASTMMSEDFQRRFAQRTPLGRVAEPDDIARAIAMLVSDDAGFITGEVLSVDGGHGVPRM